ncbi:efflux RND transporter periplasmic adaptor subunit [Schlesneria sp. DSM 10557]|uniref:efflux RND transporter periplasmic adaptor subunit n=1 Tax=Schlesneria sp. DSM 10557 TaxID=3044399 RepID=UPI0035A00CA2
MSMAMPAQELRSSQRPVPLRGRMDLVIKQIEFQGVSHFVIKDPVGLTYHRLRADQYRVLNLLDGQKSLETIRAELIREFPAISPTLTETQLLVSDLHQKGLAYSVRPGQASARIEQKRKNRRQKAFGVLTNILSVRLPGWDPDRVLAAMVPWTRWVCHPIAVAAAVGLVLSSWLLLAIQFRAFQAGLPAFQQFFGWPNLLFLWMTLAGSKIIHEFGHGLACKMFGSECHEMGVMLLVGSPCLYCDVSDSWMLKNKWHRILIGAAGMIVEVVLSAIAIFLWWLTEPGLFHFLCLNVFFVTTLTTVIFNANPLMKLDGYYMMSDFLEIPNLRQKADKLTGEFFSALCLGIEPRPDPFMPQTNQHWFILYAIASKIYGWFVLFGILTFLYTVLKPYGLQSLGQSVAYFSIAGILVQMTKSAYRQLTQPREKPIQKWRLALSGLVLAGIIGGLGMIKIPFIQWAAFMIEPQEVRHVVTRVPGELVELNVQPGDYVEAGQQLAVLYDPRLSEAKRRLTLQREVQEQSKKNAWALNDRTEMALLEESLKSIDEQLSEIEMQIRHLVVVAPVAGHVIAPARQPIPNLEIQKTRLVGWTGTPLDRKNLGAFLEERTELMSIAPSDLMQATLYVNQGDRYDIHEGLKVSLKFDHLPQQTFRGTITQIATAHSDFVPETMSVKRGGLLATKTDQDGREQLQEAAYRATVILDESPAGLRPYLRGNARFMAVQRSTFGWLWRALRRTFHFKM